MKKPLAFSSGIFPDRLKIEIVKVHNYRPISLLSVFLKTVEKFMYNRLMLFITKNNILNDAQHGFQEGKSTETATHAFLENIYIKNDKPHWTFFILFIYLFIDLSNAYDVLDHKILLFKLDAYGIRGLVDQWLKSYLSNWKPYVEIKYMENTSRILEKFTSTLKETKGGVPQCSVLGQLLFLLHINDLLINIQRGRTIPFADDTNIQIEATNAHILSKKVKNLCNSYQVGFTQISL